MWPNVTAPLVLIRFPNPVKRLTDFSTNPRYG
jgi:hypothetical protein